MQLPPPLHGASAVSRAVAASEIVASRFEVRVLAMRFAETIDDLGSVSPRKLLRALSLAARLTSQLVRARPDVAYFTLSTEGGAFYRDCAYVALIKLRSVPLVFHIHARGSSPSAVRRALLAWAMRDETVIQLSPRAQLDSAVVSGARQVAFIPNGVANDLAERPTRRAARMSVLFLSNMLREKGPLVLAEALGLLAARGIEVDATFAGTPSEETRGQLEDAIARHGIADRVSIVGRVEGAAKDELFRTHAVLAFPTYYRREIFPLVVLEAMKWGMPVVTTNIGAITDMVVEGATGFIVPPQDAGALADRLQQLSEDPALREAMGAQARQRFVESFTLAQFEQSLVDVLDQSLRPS